jgi:uncharacterized membrane protein
VAKNNIIDKCVPRYLIKNVFQIILYYEFLSLLLVSIQISIFYYIFKKEFFSKCGNLVEITESHVTVCPYVALFFSLSVPCVFPRCVRLHNCHA